MTKRRVAIYTRVSTGEQSTAVQERELRAYAKNRKWSIVRVYTDQGFSGALEKRPDQFPAECSDTGFSPLARQQLQIFW
jgi:predicted site-specific integrase-resolvase